MCDLEFLIILVTNLFCVCVCGFGTISITGGICPDCSHGWVFLPGTCLIICKPLQGFSIYRASWYKVPSTPTCSAKRNHFGLNLQPMGSSRCLLIFVLVVNTRTVNEGGFFLLKKKKKKMVFQIKSPGRLKDLFSDLH